MKTAKVIRPKYDEAATDHPSVKLTATVSHGSITKEFDLLLKVKMLGITDSQSVILDLNEINLPAATKEDLILPIVGKNGSTITWSSNTPNVVSEDGRITRPDAGEGNVKVKLTATCKKGEETQTKQYDVEIISWNIEEEIEQAYNLVSFDLIKGKNTNSQAIESDLDLPKSIGRSVKSEWAIISISAKNDIATGKLDITTGKVTRPTHTQGQVTVQISCKLSKGDKTKTKVLPTFILSPAPMTDQEVLSSATTLLESSIFLGKNESLSRIITDMELPYRLSDPDASRATITWSLATHTEHTSVASSPYIILSNNADHTAAKIIRPTSSEGNIQIALKAVIEVAAVEADGDKKSGEKYFDITILKEE